MANLVPVNQLPLPQFAWTLPAAIQLIRERRNLNNQFQSNTRNHDAAWTQVANNLFAAIRFRATAHQCRSKWNSLKRGIDFFNIITIKIFLLF
jgi:Myb/SANT-like DNA-binding domain